MKTLLAKLWKALHLPKNIQLQFMRLFQDQFLVGVTGIIFNERGQVLLFEHTYRSHAWSLPGGYMKAKEHPQEALEREIKEESGLIVSVDMPLKTRTDRHVARLDISYIGTLIGGDFRPSEEVRTFGFFAEDQLPLLRSNQVFLIHEALALHRHASSIRKSAEKMDK